MNPINPFFHRGPVRDPDYFSGRRREIEFAYDLLRQGQSIAINGPRRFGKTSLLFYLAHWAGRAQYGLGDGATTWVYLDGGTIDGLSEDYFYGVVDREMGGSGEPLGYELFVDRLRQHVSANKRIVLVFDEFELIAANARFGTAMFNRLRGLAAQLPLQFIAASKDPLLQLTFAHRDTISSPFFNIFAPITLTLFSQSEAGALLDDLSRRGGRAFAPETIAFLHDYAGPHPLFLQVAGYRAFTLQNSNGELSPADRAEVRKQIRADLEPHLQYYWLNLDPSLQYALAALPFMESTTRSAAMEQLKSAGLVRQSDDDWQALGGALLDFVRWQKVDGLLQAGPFIMDLRRGLAAAGNQPVHLTPTEFAALKLFVERAGQIVTPADIEAALWADEVVIDPERARGVVKKLRAALGQAGKTLVNRRGQGYLLAIE